MHNYIRTKASSDRKASRQASQRLQPIPPLRQLRRICETGQPLTEQTLNELISQTQSLQEKHSLINELLMNRKAKLIEKLIKSNKFNKSQVIDSNDQLKALYQSQLKEVSDNKTKSQQQVLRQQQNRKQAQQQREKQQQKKIQSMSGREWMVHVARKRFRFLKKIDRKLFVVVVGLLVVAILVKKYRAKITSLLRVLFNV